MTRSKFNKGNILSQQEKEILQHANKNSREHTYRKPWYSWIRRVVKTSICNIKKWNTDSMQFGLKSDILMQLLCVDYTQILYWKQAYKIEETWVFWQSESALGEICYSSFLASSVR